MGCLECDLRLEDLVKKSLQLLALILVSTLSLNACEARRSSSDGATDKAADTKASGRADFVVDESGLHRLNPPTILEQRSGQEVSTTELSTDAANGHRPGTSWIFDHKSKDGFFLTASTSTPLGSGGDFLRRIELGGSKITEFDYDDTRDGKQGAYILVPDEMRSALPNKLVDAEGLFSGTICGMIPGPDKTIIALAGSPEGGVAFVINPYEKEQAFTPLQVISMPYATRPCRATYSNDNKKLYIIDVTQTGAKNGQEGIFVADIYNDKRASLASFFVFAPEHKINDHSINNFQDIDLYNGVLYLLSGNARFDAEWESVIYRVPLNKAGEPLLAKRDYTRTHNPITRVQGCGLSSTNLAALRIITSSQTPLLITSGTATVIAWDISGDELKKIDLNEKRPGIQGYSLEDNGSGGVKFAFDPNGEKIYLLPNCRSNKNKVKITPTYDMMAFNISTFITKNFAPSKPIDAGYRDVLLSLKSASYMPQFSMTFKDFAVSPKYIGVLGAAASNISGLSAGGDILIIDKAKGSPMAFQRPTDMRRAHEMRYGFKLAQGDSQFENAEQNSHAIIWIP